MFAITSFYTALLIGLLLVLSIRVIRYRHSEQVSLGDQGNNRLLRRMRAQGNLAEYAPFGIIALALIEAQGAPVLWVHVLGLTLLVGRLLHGIALSGSYWGLGRIAGMGLTLTMLVLSALTLLVLALT